MDIAYNQYKKDVMEGKPDAFLSDNLQIMFISGDYVPSEGHSLFHIEKYKLNLADNMHIQSNMSAKYEKSTKYYIDDLIAINTHGAKYMLFFCNITKQPILLKEIPISKVPLSFRFNGGILFELLRDGKTRFESKTKALNYTLGNHKLIITDPKDEK